MIFGRLARTRTIQARLATVTALGVALTVIVIGLSTYLTARIRLYDALDHELIEIANYVSTPISSDIESMGGLNATALQASNLTMFLVQTDGTVRRIQGLRATVEPGDHEVAVARTQEETPARTILGTDSTYYRVVAVPLRVESNYYALVMGRPLGTTIHTLTSIGIVTTVLGLLFIGLAGVLGHLSSRQIIRPVRELSLAATRVIDTDELKPIGNTSPDELGELSRTFDRMLGSLARSRERQQRLIADAGHELRTPLTSMRTNVELLVADQTSGMLPPEARHEILTDVAAQLGEFTSLVGDLVQLSRDERLRVDPQPVEFETVVMKSVDRAERRGSSLFFDTDLEPFTVMGDAASLERAVTNLLDNAVKFSPENGTIHVDLHGGVLTVWDEGPGIAEEDLPKIFDRFYRSDKARNTPGTGLGLSIVAHTIEQHHGTVSAGNQPDAGAKFTLTLPQAPDEVLNETSTKS